MKKLSTLCLLLLMSFTVSAQKFSVGDKAWAFENDDALWYRVTIVSVVDAVKYKIHWEGFSDQYDEAMHVENIWKEGMPFLVSDKIQGMETDGKWYNIKVLKRDLDNKKYFINWGGFDAKYNRWISYDSLRLPTKENNIEEGKFSYKVDYSSSGGQTVTIKNKCAGKAYFYIPPETGSGTFKHEGLNANGSKAIPLGKGAEVWLSNEKGDKVSLLFKVGSSSGSEVIICQ
ncbi:MAG: hypothetical protein Q8M29_03410 [Bacteroidota bacterium]|nr:hypothetical protein [Bacteroidota bacterium]